MFIQNSSKALLTMNHTSKKLVMISMPFENKNKRQENFFDTCSHCKTGWSCCLGTRPPISADRRSIIEAFLKKNKIAVENAFVQEEYVFPREQPDGYCVFRNGKTGKCVIHSVKPETCVAGPVTFDINVRGGKIEWFLKFETLCPLAGVVGKNKAILKRHLASAKKEVLRLVDELDAGALKAILKKDEPETFKFDEDNVSKSVLDKLR